MNQLPRRAVNSLSLFLIVLGVILLTLLAVGQCNSRSADTSVNPVTVTIHKVAAKEDSVKINSASFEKSKTQKAKKENKKTPTDNTRNLLDEHLN